MTVDRPGATLATAGGATEEVICVGVTVTGRTPPSDGP
jgi:hypothetical protein